MKRTNTLVLGGGQAGLAMSRCLVERGIDHVVLERGRIAERWRSERWDSLRLLTPNWQLRLPGWSYRGPEPDGFMAKRDLVGYLNAYARSFDAPVLAGVTVTGVARAGAGFRVDTDRGAWHAANVVIATGNCDRPRVPAFGAGLPRDILQVVPGAYRNPEELPSGAVLVVGASATGVQLAEEIHRSGRPVILSVGRHTRLPRVYRGRDIEWWLDAMGVWDETVDTVRDLDASRREPSLQLIGSPERRTLDLEALQVLGVRLAGRATAAAGSSVHFAEDLAASVASAEAKLSRLLARIDEFIDRRGWAGDLPAAAPRRPVRVSEAAAKLDLKRERIAAVVWATGYRRSYPWLRVPVLDERGEIRHDKGVTPEPGLYVLGLQFQRTRKSSFIDGVGADAEYLAERHLTRAETRRPAAA